MALEEDWVKDLEGAELQVQHFLLQTFLAVSYTHLTLPTKRIV